MGGGGDGGVCVELKLKMRVLCLLLGSGCLSGGVFGPMWISMAQGGFARGEWGRETLFGDYG
jgi:hypothetical protein